MLLQDILNPDITIGVGGGNDDGNCEERNYDDYSKIMKDYPNESIYEDAIMMAISL